MEHLAVAVPEVLRAWVEKESDTTFWGMKVRLRPAMCPTVFGDGGRLAYLTPLNTRPNHFAVLVPSWYTEDDLAERSETLIQAIEGQFGNSDDEHDEEDADDASANEDPWPCWSDGGHSYGFFDNVPAEVMEAAQADIARQLVEQRALFVDGYRVHPGTVLSHPEFGLAQARHNETLGWHYVRPRTSYEAMPGQLGYATDFSCVSVVLNAEHEPKMDFNFLKVKVSTPSRDSAEPRRAGETRGGQFQQVLAGRARARAHCALLPILGERGAAADDEALELARLDPSLFLEPIPASDPLGMRLDKVWSAQSTWYGNWLTKAAANGFPKTIGALLAAGLHPDDPAAFRLRPLAWHTAWAGDPERLALALSHGASPDSPEVTETPGGARALPNNSLVRQFLLEIRHKLALSFRDDSTTARDSDGLTANVRCLELLLAAGARKLDVVADAGRADNGAYIDNSAQSQPAICCISSFLGKVKDRPDLHGMLLGLVRKLHASGADASARSQRSTPVIDAVVAKDMAAFQTYLELGAKVGDADVVSTEYPKVGSVLEEAQATGGPEWRAEVAEAMMRHAMKTSGPPVPADAPAQARPRRRSVAT